MLPFHQKTVASPDFKSVGVKEISKTVTVKKGDMQVSFTCDTPLGMLAWRLA